MIESVITMLIYLCLLAIAVYLIQWVLGQLGIVIPENIMKILWVIVVLVALLMIVRTFLPAMRVGYNGLPPVISYLLPTHLLVG